MPIENYIGDTFVAFTDISGFKEMMKTGERAATALDSFYQAGYDVLREHASVSGTFVSDCGVLFVNQNTLSNRDKLTAILEVVKALNRNMLSHNIMLTTSIAYGPFQYQGRIEFRGIAKNCFVGDAYLESFLDNERGSPRIQPGQCRILRKNLPTHLIHAPQDVIAGSPVREGKRHFAFYWMTSDGGVDEFELAYHDTYQLKYQGMLSALKVAIGDGRPE